MTTTFVPAHSNNFALGRQGHGISAVVLHWIVGHLSAADATFQDPKRGASAHYGIEGETIHQYVREKDTAFANGNWTWNLDAISIEHAGGPDLPISDATYETSAKLVADICTRYGIPIDRGHIKRHQEVSDSPTACPGNLDVDRIVKRARELQGGSDTMNEEQYNVRALTEYYQATGLSASDARREADTRVLGGDNFAKVIKNDIAVLKSQSGHDADGDKFRQLKALLGVK